MEKKENVEGERKRGERGGRGVSEEEEETREEKCKRYIRKRVRESRRESRRVIFLLGTACPVPSAPSAGAEAAA